MIGRIKRGFILLGIVLYCSNLCSQPPIYPSFHGKKYKAINPTASGSPFFNNQELVGSLTWFGIEQNAVHFYYELVKDVVLIRQTVGKTTYLIELPKQHVQYFSTGDQTFINIEQEKLNLKNNPLKLSGFVSPVIMEPNFKALLKYRMKITSFANQPSHELQLINHIWCQNRWWNIESLSDLRRFMNFYQLDLKTHLKGLPAVKKFTDRNWIELWDRVKIDL